MAYIPMTAPESTGNFETKEKLDTIQLLPTGPCLGILTQIVDLGTHETNFKDDFGNTKVQRKLKMTFEFNGYKQLFYVGDTEPMPTTIFKDYNFSIARYEKTGNTTALLEDIEAMTGQKLKTEQDRKNFDIGSLLGMPFVCQVIQADWKDKKTGETRYGNNITSFAPYNAQVYNFPADHLNRTGELVGFVIHAHGFDSPILELVPGWMKAQIRKSHEFIAHAAKGGKLYGDDEADAPAQAPQQFANSFAQGAQQAMGQAPATSFQQAPTPAPAFQQAPALPPTPTPAPAVPVKKWLNETYTYEQMIANGWNDQQLIENGYMAMEVPAPALPPTPAPIPAPAPAPAPAFQQAPQVAPTPANNVQQPFQQAPAAAFGQAQFIAPAAAFQQIPAQPSNGDNTPPDDLPF